VHIHSARELLRIERGVHFSVIIKIKQRCHVAIPSSGSEQSAWRRLVDDLSAKG